MGNELTLIVCVLGGVLIGGFLAYYVGIRVILIASERNLHAQLVASERKLRLELESDFRRRQQRLLEESYGKLMGWLYELDIAVDGVWAGIHAKEPDVLKDLRITLEEWPWKTLKPPEYVASTQHCWSVEVRDLLTRFYGRSVSFVDAAHGAVRQPQEESGDSEILQTAVHATWEGRSELQRIIVKIREQARLELLNPPPLAID
ncbi:hypothetical protein [Kibdelosporangium aridum]|uniref:hypothetical protein n=1 Tax=Kibdelosporangium aridum TaxID=2030 RepID=UPI0005270CBB